MSIFDIFIHEGTSFFDTNIFRQNVIRFPIIFRHAYINNFRHHFSTNLNKFYHHFSTRKFDIKFRHKNSTRRHSTFISNIFRHQLSTSYFDTNFRHDSVRQNIFLQDFSTAYDIIRRHSTPVRCNILQFSTNFDSKTPGLPVYKIRQDFSTQFFDSKRQRLI